MAYGTGELGQDGFGGSSFELQAAYLYASSPANGAQGVAVNAPLTMSLVVPAGADLNFLTVLVAGQQAIVGGEFLSGYGGTILQDPETSVEISITTHPDFSGSVSISASVTSFSGDQSTFPFTFSTVVGVQVSEAFSWSEAAGSLQRHVVAVQESRTLSEQATTQMVAGNAVTESVAWSESTTTVLGMAQSEAVSITEQLTTDLTPAGSLATDLLLLSEQVSATLHGHVATSETVGLAEAGDTGDLVILGTSMTQQEAVTATVGAGVQTVFETLGLTEGLQTHEQANVSLAEPLVFQEQATGRQPFLAEVQEELSLHENLLVGDGSAANIGGTLVLVSFPSAVRLDQAASVRSYSITSDGIPVTLQGVTPLMDILASGSSGQATAGAGYQVELDTTLTGLNVGDYLSILVGAGQGEYRILSVDQLSGPARVTLEAPVPYDPSHPAWSWELGGAVHGALLETSKLANDTNYQVRTLGLKDKLFGISADFTVQFTGQLVPRPVVQETQWLQNETVIVTFGEQMLQDQALTNPGDYTFSGPTDVKVKRVRALGPDQVALDTSGFEAGTYQLIVSTSTPRDLGGNPMDPAGNQMAFQANVSEASRCIYTDRGPIAKPPLVLQQGSAGMIEGAQQATLTGGVFAGSDVGKQVQITGSQKNDGTYLVLDLVSSSRLTLKANLQLPDSQNGNWAWTLVDPRDGQIADDPGDVAVRINGIPAEVESVNGLLGQVALLAQPTSTDQVVIDYHWIDNPTVQIRGMNRPEFRLNCWNRNGRTTNRTTQHFYRYNNVLPAPKKWSQGLLADLPQPTSRDIRYRAYELEYSALTNRKSRLRYNTPRHRIAYPAANRTLSEVFVPYEALVVPDLDPQNPWVRRGSGLASCLAGVLTCQDNLQDQPLFWARPLDLSYDHVFAMSWRGSGQVLASPDGVWTGVAAGYSDPQVGVVVGFLEVAGVRQVGLLVRGASDPGDLASWQGGLVDGAPTGLPVVLDWSVTRTYRLYRSPQGVVSLYCDGSPLPIASLTTGGLPFLADMPTPFDSIQGVWFGSLSRPAQVTSLWDFVRYQAIPTNSLQYGYTGLLDYDGSILPEQAARPWTPVGSCGGELIVSSNLLSLNNTSALDSSGGAMEGAYRAHARLEPLLGTASQVMVEATLQGLSGTFGADPNGLTLVVNDGTRMLQSSWIQDQRAPRLSYGGQVEPERFGTFGWTRTGGAVTRMAGHALQITDTSTVDGVVFSCDDLEPDGSQARTVSAGHDYTLEVGCRVLSYQPDGAGFCGVMAQVFDGLKVVGFMLVDDGSPKVALTSDGTIKAQWSFTWNNQQLHRFRVRKDTGADQVVLFCDDTLLGILDYSLFTTVGSALEGQVTFGSATPISTGARSDVEWSYCNAWRATTPRRYWGLWAGGQTGTLLDFHLPAQASGTGSTMGNSLFDPGAQWQTAGVQAGDLLVIPHGINQGTYEVATVLSETTLTITGTWPALVGDVPYVIPAEVDWTQIHTYKLDRTPSGEVILSLDGTAILQVPYGSGLPECQGAVQQLSGGLPSIIFGSLSGPDLGSSLWDRIRYQITRNGSDLQPVPQLQVLNQWNVMHSGERLRTQIPHTVTSFRSSSTGIPPHTDPDLLANPAMTGNTVLNEGTPIVPLRQAIRDQLESLYTCLDQITVTTGENGLVQPFTDRATITGLQWVKDVCLTYDATTLPEDSGSGTPWVLVSDSPSSVYTSVAGGSLTYGTTGATRTAYKNDTPLLDATSLASTVKFRVRVNQDTTFGIGDSQIRLGFSAPEMTLGLAFQTHPDTMERFVNVLDMKSGLVVGSCTFDYLDGQFHTYKLERDPTSRQVRVWIES
jgi:hypothetical protein